MDNYGNKKGYNNRSGKLYIVQGLTNTASPAVQLPNSKVWEPKYENKYNTQKTMEYVRNNKKPKHTGVRRLSLLGNMADVGGNITNKDVNTI